MPRLFTPLLMLCLLAAALPLAANVPSPEAITDARRLLAEMTTNMEMLVKSLQEARDASAVAAAIDIYARMVKQLGAQAKIMEEKHGKLENMEENPLISTELEKFQAVAHRFMETFSTIMEKWGSDETVTAALTRLNESVNSGE